MKYPIQTWNGDGPISRTRVKRLLLVATEPRDHKPYYYQYYYLIHHDLIRWIIGTAFLTDKGRQELIRLEEEDDGV